MNHLRSHEGQFLNLMEGSSSSVFSFACRLGFFQLRCARIRVSTAL